MLSLFSVVLFGIDGALVSFESLQLVCKVSVTLQASHVVPWNRTIPMNIVGRAYCVSSTRSSSLKDASINAKSK